MIKEKTIVSTATLATSLLMYFYARNAEKDAVPYVMIGGFMGAVIGESIVEYLNKQDKNRSFKSKIYLLLSKFISLFKKNK